MSMPVLMVFTVSEEDDIFATHVSQRFKEERRPLTSFNTTFLIRAVKPFLPSGVLASQ